MVDEAYIDFADSVSFLSELGNFENLVVLQTFSKAWGMAGLRLGVAYCNPVIIKILNKIKYPYNLNVLSQQKLSEALDKVKEKNAFVKEINGLRGKLADNLKQIPSVIKIFPSDSNMLLVKFYEAKKLFNYLLEQKVIVRDRSNVVLCDDCLRLSIGTEAENQALLKAIKSFV